MILLVSKKYMRLLPSYAVVHKILWSFWGFCAHSEPVYTGSLVEKRVLGFISLDVFFFIPWSEV